MAGGLERIVLDQLRELGERRHPARAYLVVGDDPETAPEVPGTSRDVAIRQLGTEWFLEGGGLRWERLDRTASGIAFEIGGERALTVPLRSRAEPGSTVDLRLGDGHRLAGLD